MTLEQSLYHKTLRVLAVVVAFVLLFESGLLIEATADLSDTTHRYVANVVGVGASVQRTELNSLSAELTEQRLLLDQREAALNAREIEIGLNENRNRSDWSTYITASILFVLLVLIVLNYALDYLRATTPRQPLQKSPVQ